MNNRLWECGQRSASILQTKWGSWCPDFFNSLAVSYHIELVPCSLYSNPFPWLKLYKLLTLLRSTTIIMIISSYPTEYVYSKKLELKSEWNPKTRNRQTQRNTVLRHHISLSLDKHDCQLLQTTANVHDRDRAGQLTSQTIVRRSPGRSPLASSISTSRRMNFLKPQSLPWTKRYALWLSRKKEG